MRLIYHTKIFVYIAVIFVTKKGKWPGIHIISIQQTSGFLLLLAEQCCIDDDRKVSGTNCNKMIHCAAKISDFISSTITPIVIVIEMHCFRLQCKESHTIQSAQKR